MKNDTPSDIHSSIFIKAINVLFQTTATVTSIIDAIFLCLEILKIFILGNVLLIFKEHKNRNLRTLFSDLTQSLVWIFYLISMFYINCRVDVQQERSTTLGRKADHQDAAPRGDTELSGVQVSGNSGSVPNRPYYRTP